MDQVRWGILGTGRIAERFAIDLRLAPGARLVAVGSRSLQRAAGFVATVGVGRAVEGYQTLAEAEDVDVVYVATPTSDHARNAIMCLQAGKAVLIEKPIAATAADARAIVDAARKAKRFCMEAMWMRFTPGQAAARELVQDGVLGALRRLDADFLNQQPYDPTSRFYDPKLGGGSLLDLGVYPISLALSLFGLPDTVDGRCILAPTGVDRQASVLLGYRDKIAVLSCGFDAQGANDAVINAERGRLRIHGLMLCPPYLSIRKTSAASGVVGRKAPGPRGLHRLRQLIRPLDPRGLRFVRTPYAGTGLQYQVTEVQRGILAGALESPLMPLSDSVAVLEIIDQVRATPV